MIRSCKRLFPVVAAGILITIGGCADVPTAAVPPAPDAEPTAVRTSRGTIAGTTALIGPAGGTISAGGHTLVFPAGALPRPTMIGMKPMEGYAGAVFSPHGLVFPASAQPELTLSLEGADLSQYGSLAIGYQAPSGEIMEVYEAERSETGNSISSRIPHFSGYIAVAD
jgi:hypothetical protein